MGSKRWQTQQCAIHPTLISDDSIDEEDFNYLLASTILPFVASASAGASTSGLAKR